MTTVLFLIVAAAATADAAADAPYPVCMTVNVASEDADEAGGQGRQPLLPCEPNVNSEVCAVRRPAAARRELGRQHCASGARHLPKFPKVPNPNP